MSNRLINETSPYLLQHAHNPVDWYPWGSEALQRAREENKPIFLSVGYAACHWCHVMEHELFEDPATAKILNQSFISIKVDREERPDIDMVYMLAVQNITGSGGWPLNVFLTPDGKPFYGGTYFPPVPRYGMPAFTEILTALAKMWHENSPKIFEEAAQISGQVAAEAYWVGKPQAAALGIDRLESATRKLLDDYDWEHGGWGGPPKFPAPMTIEFLLSQSLRGNGEALKVAVHALQVMRQGGMYDLVGGGFHRYSTDENWLVPHFEKMLYDNAQLALAYLHAFQITGESVLRQTAQETLDFILREMTGPEGGFYSSLDADSEGEEGKFYVWTVDELKLALGSAQDYDFLASEYDILSSGNFEGKIILRSKKDPAQSLSAPKFSEDQVAERRKQCHQKLLAYRSHRQRPATDSKILVSWNAIAIQAFVLGGKLMNRPDYTAAANNAADFLMTHLYESGVLARSWNNGSSRHKGTLEDYGDLISALLDLYQSDFNMRWYSAAAELTAKMVEQFQDPAGGFFLTPADQTDLGIRPKDLQDNVTPSGNSAAIFALLRMSSFTGNSVWYSLAEKALSQLQDTLARYPNAFPHWLRAMDFAVGPVSQVAVIYPPGSQEQMDLISQFQHNYHPRSIIAAASFPPVPDSPELLHDRPALGEKPAWYFCHGFVCDLPLTDAGQIQAAITSIQ